MSVFSSAPICLHDEVDYVYGSPNGFVIMDLSGANASDALLGSNTSYSLPPNQSAQSVVTITNTVPQREPLLLQLSFSVQGTERVEINVYDTDGIKAFQKWVSLVYSILRTVCLISLKDVFCSKNISTESGCLFIYMHRIPIRRPPLLF